MISRTLSTLAGVAAFAMTVACAGEANTRDGNTNDLTAGDASRVDTPTITATGTVSLTLTGPVMPGTHTASGEVLCFQTGADWGMTFEEPGTDPSRVSGVLALVSGVGPQGGRSDQFNLSVVWGDPMSEQQPGGMAEVNTRAGPAGGTGTATIERSGNTVTMSLNARRPEGLTMEATIRCTAAE